MRRYSLFRLILLSLAVFIVIIVPVQAAERIYFNYSILGRSIAVSELVTFAQTGEVEGVFGDFLKLIPETRQNQLRKILQASYHVDPLMVERFAYTAPGERLFREIGEFLQSEASQNGGRGIRSAAILAAADPNGISVIRFLQKFPTDIRINLARLLSLVRQVTDILKQTQQTAKLLHQQTLEQVNSRESPNLEIDLRQSGSFSYKKQTLNLYDSERQRVLITDLYLPETQANPIPLIVMSNGLGARRNGLEDLAMHLASHGFAIAIPDHPGSDLLRLRRFYDGLEQENFDASDYLQRPQDISFLLNQLEQMNPDLRQPLNLQQVGIFGYSFGGSTALSLAGARLDAAFLQSDCQSQLGLFNISLLYQCRALDLPQDTAFSASFRDDRIVAAFLFVPFGKSLFGPRLADLQIPIFWQVTDLDILTPLVVEQLPAFERLTSERYLALAQGLPHARVTYDALGRFSGNSISWETLADLGHAYQNALSLAFFQLYLTQNQDYRSYLTPAYAQAISQAPYFLSLQAKLSDISRESSTAESVP